jgi:hypothetical protein
MLQDEIELEFRDAGVRPSVINNGGFRLTIICNSNYLHLFVPDEYNLPMPDMDREGSFYSVHDDEMRRYELAQPDSMDCLMKLIHELLLAE